MSTFPFVPLSGEKASYDAFIGEAPAFRQLVRMIDRVAPTDHALLIIGPTGSGKELVARRVHTRSLRHDQPFVDVNCGAIPEHLVEAELFGQTLERATQSRKRQCAGPKKAYAPSDGTTRLNAIKP